MEGSKKYFIFQEGNDIMFVINVPPDQLDQAVLQAFNREVKSRGLERIIFSNVEEIIRGAEQGEVVKIGEFSSTEQADKFEARDASEAPTVEVEVKEKIDPEDLPFSIVVDPDAMEATLEMENPGVNITREHIDAGLQHMGITYGLIEENIEKILSEWPKIFKTVIAEGSHPQQGEDAELELVKTVKDNLAPKVTDEGFVDFKHLDLISPIEAGEVLQVRKPPTPGVPGYDVYGKIIPSTPGKDEKLQKGQNTEISEDGTQLLSTKEGFLSVDPSGRIDVRPVYTVPGDVDYSTGNIDYKNDVLIKGDVLSGFSVRAGGDIHIYGAVEDPKIEAKGSITINGGVLSSGKKDAFIRAGGDVSVGFIQHGTIEAGGSVHIRIESVGSRITAGRDIEVTKRNGRIVGGNLIVGGWVVAQVLGSDNGPKLNIEFKAPPNSPADPDKRYEHCFVATKSLLSGLQVQYGMLTTRVSHMNSPMTVAFREKQIVIVDHFPTTEELALRRKLRNQESEDEAVEAEANE
jgi:uncharacterized protein (DUF342 family)